MNPPLWVISDLFFGYILCIIIAVYFKNKKYSLIIYAGLEYVLYITNKCWLFCIVLGMLFCFFVMSEDKYIRKIRKYSQNYLAIFLELALAYYCFTYTSQVPYAAYYMYSFGAVFFIMAIKNSGVLNCVMSNKYFVMFGDYSFESYILHIFILYFVVPPIRVLNLNVLIIFIIYLGVVMLLTLFYKRYVSSLVNKLIYNVVNK